MLDCLLLSLFIGSEPFQPPPFDIEGLELEPSIETLSSQVTGDGASTLIVRRSAGKIRCVLSTTEFATTEDVVATSSGHAYNVNDAGTKLASGNAVWFTGIAVQHAPTGAVGIMYVPGAVAAVASAVVATQAQIQAVVGDGVVWVIIGDVCFYRSADTVISTRVDRSRRPSYVLEANKTAVVYKQDDTSDMASEFACYVMVYVDYTSISAVADDGTYINGMLLPKFPFGGYIKGWRNVPVVAGVGAGASNVIRLAIDGVDCVGGDLTITEANTAIGQGVEDVAFTSANSFLPGASLDVEVDTTATSFTGGSGMLQIEIWKYVK